MYDLNSGLILQSVGISQFLDFIPCSKNTFGNWICSCPLEERWGKHLLSLMGQLDSGKFL